MEYLTPAQAFPCELARLQIILDRHDVVFSLMDTNVDGADYSACRFRINGRVVEFRAGKITPKKPGHFYALWRREQGVPVPFSVDDDFDALMVSVRSDDNCGVFFYTKDMLANLKLIASDKSDGKQGTRVYAPWETELNKTAQQTQKIHEPFFFDLNSEESVSVLSRIFARN